MAHALMTSTPFHASADLDFMVPSVNMSITNVTPSPVRMEVLALMVWVPTAATALWDIMDPTVR